MAGFGREDNGMSFRWMSGIRSDEHDMGVLHKVSARSLWLSVVLNCLTDIFVLRD
jgi:hypothetical protein